MKNFSEIKREIKKDPMNKEFTDKNMEPLYKANKDAKIVIIGQAPGKVVQESGTIWNDKSGDRLRDWLGVSRKEFYDTDTFALLPMDFYYPGKAKTGDNKPRKDFANKWHKELFKLMPNLKLYILVGRYAQDYYLKDTKEKNLTETVKNYKNYLPKYFPIIHPSPLNGRWLSKNPWFEKDVVPELKKIVKEVSK